MALAVKTYSLRLLFGQTLDNAIVITHIFYIVKGQLGNYVAHLKSRLIGRAVGFDLAHHYTRFWPTALCLLQRHYG